MPSDRTATYYRTHDVDGLTIFYREAGIPSAPAILLLHGFPTSSHMFRDLIPLLAPHFHIIAPDMPGFGFSDAPSRSGFTYTFDRLADVIEAFTEAIGLNCYALYIFDYGAPVGLRLAIRHPERVTAIVSQNGNAYEEGLSDSWNPVRKYWTDPTSENRAALKAFLSPESIKWQYTYGADALRVAPESCALDAALLGRSGNEDAQLDLFLDYANNIKLYPRFQNYFRTYQPPTLAVWGKSDPFFLPAGADGFKRDNPNARVEFLDTGHFALETHSAEIGAKIIEFLAPRRPLLLNEVATYREVSEDDRASRTGGSSCLESQANCVVSPCRGVPLFTIWESERTEHECRSHWRSRCRLRHEGDFVI